MSKNWFEHWFSSEEYLDVYQHRNDEDSEKIVNLILSNLKLSERARVLDAACGAGRHAIHFAKRGFRVIGFDLSRTLLDIAEQEAENLGLDVEFKLADLRIFESELKFDLIVSLFTSFGYFDSDEENFIFVGKSYEMLNKNGFYVLDYLNKTYLENNLVESTVKSLGNKRIEENRRISDDRVIKEIKIHKSENKEEYIESVKLYSYQELLDKFSQIGFKNIKVFGDYNGSIYHEESSERCIMIFQK